MNNPDNAMARPLSRAEEDRLYGGEEDRAAAIERTLNVIKSGIDAAFDELEIGEYEKEAALIVQALRLAATGRDDAVIAAAVKELLACVARNRDASFWREADERTRRIRDAWKLSNEIASMACGLNVRGDK